MGAGTTGAVGGGDPIPGFDFGNSPSALQGAKLAGRPLIQTTAAGVRIGIGPGWVGAVSPIGRLQSNRRAAGEACLLRPDYFCRRIISWTVGSFIISLRFIALPLGMITSPGFWPGLPVAGRSVNFS